MVHGRGHHHKIKFHSGKFEAKRIKHKQELTKEKIEELRLKREPIWKKIIAIFRNEGGWVDWWLLLISVGVLSLLAWMIIQLISFDNGVHPMYK